MIRLEAGFSTGPEFPDRNDVDPVSDVRGQENF